MTRQKMSVAETEVVLEKKRMDAERVTLLAQGFLYRLGYTHGMRPTKASVEGEKYVVELQLKKKTARVDIDIATEEVRAYQIEEAAETGFRFPLTRRTLMIIISGIAAAAILITLNLMGMLSF